jgi:hypothetical protein
MGEDVYHSSGNNSVCIFDHQYCKWRKDAIALNDNRPSVNVNFHLHTPSLGTIGDVLSFIHG